VIKVFNSYMYNQYSKSIVVKVLRADQVGRTGYSPLGSQSRGHM
jgi:hypothetical protein